jgi:nucleoside-diphosphate-sugar epimerase
MSAHQSPYAGKSVLIAGCAGFIGTHLARSLAVAGARVVSMSRASQAEVAVPRVPRAFVTGDTRDEAIVASLISRRFDYAFHLAAYSGQVPGFADHEQSLTTNCLGLLNMLDAIRRLSPATVLCFPSSRLVYGRTPDLPVDESHPAMPLSLYGVHKRACEEYCAYYGERWGVRTAVLRLANPYGPHHAANHNRYNVANWMIDEIVRDRSVTIFGRGEQLRDYVYIDDAVDAMLAAASDERAHGRVYNVGSGLGTPLVEFARTAIALAGAGSYRFAPWPDDHLQVETGGFTASISKIRDEIGWSPRVSLRTGLARTVAAQRRSMHAGRQARLIEPPTGVVERAMREAA